MLGEGGRFGVQLGTPDLVRRIVETSAAQSFACQVKTASSFEDFVLGQLPKNHFAHLNRAGALKKAQLRPGTLITFTDTMTLTPDTTDLGEEAIRIFRQNFKQRLGIDPQDPKVQVRPPTFFEAVLLDWEYFNKTGKRLFKEFAIRTASFLLEHNRSNNLNGYELVEDPVKVREVIEEQAKIRTYPMVNNDGQTPPAPLLNIWIGRPSIDNHTCSQLIVDVALPQRVYPYLYCPPVVIVTEG